MDVKVFRKDELRTSAWSGGTTTELAIFPEGADYASRRFLWRVSTARVDMERSAFTMLPGVHRRLMLLDGAITLTHKGRGSAKLLPFAAPASFEGDWETVSAGKCRDFNLMLREGFEGALGIVENNAAIRLFEKSGKESWEGFYSLAANAGLTIRTGGEERKITLNEGDFALLHEKGASGWASLTADGGAGRPPAARASIRAL